MIRLNYHSGSTILKALFEKNKKYLKALFNNMTAMNRMYLQYAEEHYGLLHYAVTFNNITIVRHLLRAGLPADGATDSSERLKRTTLHKAVMFGKCHVVKLLLDYGGSINLGDVSNRTPLHYALKNFISQPTVPAYRTIVCHLLRRGADVNIPSIRGVTPLIYAVKYGSEEMVRLLLRFNADPNKGKLRNGDNALHLAVRNNHSNIVEKLLKSGADVNSRTRRGRTALHIATMGIRSEEIVDILIAHGALVDATDDRGKTPILTLDLDAYYDVDDEDEDDEDDDDDDDDEQEVEDGEQVEQQDEEQALQDNEEERKRLADGAYNLMHRLLESGAEINHIDNNGEPAFHWIIQSGFESVTELFLERGADIHCMNRYGRSPLHIAAMHASEKIVRMLLDRGLSVNYTTPTAVTPLHLAVQFKRSENIKLLLERGADINACDVKGRTPLHYAAFLEDDDSITVKSIVDVLLTNEANPFQKSNEDKTPLDLAIVKVNRTVITALLNHLADLEDMGDDNATEIAMRAIDNVDEWMEIYENRRRNIAKMKNEIIYRNISYFDVLNGNANVLVRNVDFVEAFQKNQVIKSFECYDMITKVIDIALYTKELKKKATEYLYEIISRRHVIMLPIVELIVEDFPFDYLESFVLNCEADEKMGKN